MRNTLAFLLSIILIGAAIFFKSTTDGKLHLDGSEVGNILLAVGTSICASSIFIYLTLKRISRESERIELFEKLGLIKFYLTRAEITQRCTELLQDAERIDITAIRLKTLLQTHEKKLRSLLINTNVQIRILLPDPDSVSAKIVEELIEAEEPILTGLKKLLDWVDDVKKDRLTGTIEIRYSSKLISSMYQRIDNVIFTGPYMSKVDSQNTYTIECEANKQFGKILSKYFDNRFKEGFSELRRTPFIIEFLGMPGAGKTTCLNALKAKHGDFISHSNEEVDCSPSDTPFDFNTRLLASLRNKIDTENWDLLFLDRGLEDAKIWIKFHKENETINEEEFQKLSASLPVLPNEINHYKILFLQKPIITTQRRKIERRIDEWALQEQSLEKLYALYYSKSRQRNRFIVIDSSKPLQSMEKQVINAVENILLQENVRI